MGSKKRDIVDSFVFRRAKQAVDELTKPDKQTNYRSRIISGSYQDQDITGAISEQDQDHNNIGADIYHVHSMSVPDMEQEKGATKEQDHIKTDDTPEISLSARQSQVYLWFKNRGKTGIFNKSLIQQQLDIPYISIRKAVDKLERCGIIKLTYDTCQKMYQYVFNDRIKVKLITTGAGSYQDHINNTSSSSNNKTTTKSDLQVYLSHPRFLYWRDKGLTVKQLENWIAETKMGVDEMLQSLEHCWFDMVHLKKEEKKEIRDVLSWFYKTIRKVGFYPPPAGFKPYEEIRAEEMARARKRREEAIKKLKEEARKEYETEKEARFWEMMNNPDSDLYKKCFSRLNNFEKKLKRGPAFESLMRRVFDELYESLS